VIRLIRVEMLKLRVTRLSYGLLATGAGLTALFAVLEADRAGTGKGGVAPLDTVSGFNSVITGGVWAMLLAGVLGVTVTSGEFRHSTATQTYLAAPARGRVQAAKALAAALAGAVFGAAGYAASLVTGLAFVAAKGYTVPVGDAALARYGAGSVLGAALMAAVGAGLGALLRSQLAAVIAVFVWSVVIESLLGGLFPGIRPYLPYTAAATLAGTPLGGAAFGPAHGVTGSSPLPFAASAALVAAVATVLSVAAARTTLRQDIS
jgi:ABC-2 type transport system permease protein